MEESNDHKTKIIKIKDILIGGNKKVIISGPCAVEEEATMLEMVGELKIAGVHMLRGGAFKPRTSPFDFQGLGFEGLAILKRAGEKYNLPVSSEILDPRDVERALDYIDVIQIGSRNMYNYSLLKEIGKTRVPIILKRGMNATYKEWIYAAEYIIQGGNEKIIFCERGIRSFVTETRNTLDLNAVPYIKQNTNFPIIVDPSHGTGIREFVSPMSMAALACGADGLIIEAHKEPDKALSDGAQSITIDTLSEIIKASRNY